MKTHEIVDAARACADEVRAVCRATSAAIPPAKRLDDLTLIPWRAADGLGHLLFMCAEIERLIVEAVPHGYAAAAEALKIEPTKHFTDEWTAYSTRREKAMRWLGFVQGTLWGWGISTIDELKRMNAPTAGAPDGS